MSGSDPVRIALLGCGTVGRRVAQRLMQQSDPLEAAIGRPIELARILVRDPSRDRGLDSRLFTNRFEDLLLDPSIDLAIEVIGGLEPAREYVSRLLERGVSVVTANKTLVAHHGPTLRGLAARSGAAIAHEACVGGAVPVLNTLRGLAGDRVNSVRGIINGSCNFILSRMSRQGCRLDQAVQEAQARGLVEPDPSADLSGRDAAEKLCIIAEALGRSRLPSQVECRGIESIRAGDIAAARRAGGVIKLVAELDERGARVGPVILPARHPLAAVHDENNAVLIHAELAGELLLRGRGAGADPTASSILGDVVRMLNDGCYGLARTPSRASIEIDPPTPRLAASRSSRGTPGAVARWFVRIAAARRVARPETVLNVLRDRGIRHTRLEWRDGAITLIAAGATRQVLIDAARALSGDAIDGDPLIVPWLDERAEAPAGGAHARDMIALEAAA